MGGAVFPPSCLTWGQTMVEVMKKMETSFQRSCMHCWTQCPGLCSRPPLTHTSAVDSWTLPGKSGSVSCGVIDPFSWVLVHTRFCSSSKSLFPWSCVSPGGSLVGLKVTSSKRAYAIPRSAAPRVHTPIIGHSWYVPLNETLNHSRACLASLCGDSLCA